jgi:hypothetical protein
MVLEVDEGLLSRSSCDDRDHHETVTHPDSGSLRARLVVRGRVNYDLRNDDSARGMMSPQIWPNDDLVGG